MSKNKSLFLLIKYFIYQMNETRKLGKPIYPPISDIFYYFNVNRNRVASSFDVELPWISLGALRFLKKIMQKEMVVFEYGSGGSTIFFSKLVSQVISVEHSPEWFQLLEKVLRKKEISNVDLNLVLPENKNNREIIIESRRFPELIGFDFFNYVNIINKFEKSNFDLVFIDGRARVACFEACVSKVKPGGFIVLDNSERLEYEKVMSDYSTWVIYKYYGPVVQELIFSETTIFKKPILN